MSKMNIHQIRIDFHVTEQIRRFVYVYVIEAESLYLIDSGVFGSEKQICDCFRTFNRDVSELKGIFLTHAHPDHIGSAAWFQEHTGCTIYASEGEKRWIEDINLQFQERPIPNFYHLAGQSSRVDVTVRDGDVIRPEKGLEIKIIRTAGHSQDGMSYQVGRNLFIGDAVPVKGDIPIFVDELELRKTLGLLNRQQMVDTYYPAWDQIYTKELMKQKIQEAVELVDLLKKTVVEIDTVDDRKNLSELTDLICDRLMMPLLKENPLFKRTIESLR